MTPSGWSTTAHITNTVNAQPSWTLNNEQVNIHPIGQASIVRMLRINVRGISIKVSPCCISVVDPS